ncbi:MAG TPA: DUF116 domain-containing protein [Polyangiaceae bacterium]|nr:DUF116 domain-containing protein [Polyangiaceae bacterium]
MNAPTYSLRAASPDNEPYLGAVRRLADWVEASGEVLRPVIEAYAEFVELNGREQRRSNSEYLLEGLVLGVMWRARGREALEPSESLRGLVTELVRERRSGAPLRRDESRAALANLGNRSRRGRIDPTLQEIHALLNWMLATGEYDDEVARLEGWTAFLSTTQSATNREILRLVVAFAVRFEAIAERYLGGFTEGVNRFFDQELVARGPREDTLQCSRRRVEYHLNMVGAEMLNRAWRRGFLACRRHVVVMPGCVTLREETECRAVRAEVERKCTHCTLGCSVSAATRMSERAGADAVFVMHGSNFSRFLDAQALKDEHVGVIGIACAAGLLGAGWRARSKGLMAQCVLLNASGCLHWQSVLTPTTFDVAELSRILGRDEFEVPACLAPRVA